MAYSIYYAHVYMLFTVSSHTAHMACTGSGTGTGSMLIYPGIHSSMELQSCKTSGKECMECSYSSTMVLQILQYRINSGHAGTVNSSLVFHGKACEYCTTCTRRVRTRRVYTRTYTYYSCKPDRYCECVSDNTLFHPESNPQTPGKGNPRIYFSNDQHSV